MGVRDHLLFELSRRRLPEPAERTVDYAAYQKWREQSLSSSWQAFQHVDLRGKDVLDFGCGDGALSLFLAAHHCPITITGVDLNPDAIRRAKASLRETEIPAATRVRFLEGSIDRLPIDEGSVDVIVAFDCLEHVMSPLEILRDWFRVLRPGGRCLLEWFPYKGPWGPHMESLIPVPWAHVVFGQKAMFRAAERVYDLPEFVPRHWDLDDRGEKKPNKWKQWSSFREQAYINELDMGRFRKLVGEAGLRIDRLNLRSFGGSAPRRVAGQALMSLPVIGEYFISFATIELIRPH